ncbi:hypothetical protein ACFOWB_15640 [Chenggangzhangella methanolivorans]
MTRKPLALALLVALAATEAMAQTPSPYASRRVGPAAELKEGEILVQARRSVTLPVERLEDAGTRQDDAVRMIYRMIDRDCGLLLETIAETCELASLSVTSSYADRTTMRIGAQPTTGASANFAMKVRLKAATGSAR